MAPARIGIVGASWRAEYYLRAARELPEQFVVVKVLVQSESSAERVTAKWGVSATTSLETFLAAGRFDYVVVSTPPDAAPDLVTLIARRDVPVLTETPPATSEERLFQLYRDLEGRPVQVAEQYQYQPHHAARLAIARSGVLGDVAHTRMSVAHGYHGISLIRLFLGAGFEPVTISAHVTSDPLISARGRDAWHEELVSYESGRTFATLEFEGHGVGHYEFDFEQYFSPIRPRHIEVYGSRGDIHDDRVDYVTGVGRATSSSLTREVTGADGDLEGLYLRSVSLGDTTHWSTRFPHARLNDDELAVAEVMFRMSEYVAGGAAFYPLADGAHDQYLSLLLNRSAEEGSRMTSGEVPWASALSAVGDAAA